MISVIGAIGEMGMSLIGLMRVMRQLHDTKTMDSESYFQRYE
jgi:hypothetical protein